ncbi:odorant-binding protein 84a [Arctopsyche grandis]|uniref:odorant-binding protein 84a n=1 Tax=Arctopsyche grandis TaxID=121162 RepID=UPI00406D7EF3
MFTYLATFLMTVLILTKGDKGDKSSSHGSDLRNEFKALNFTEVQQQCNDTYKIEKEYLISLSESGSFPEETELTPKCYIKCLLETLKIIDDKENINVESAIQYLNHLRGNQDLNATSIIVTRCAEDRIETCVCEKSYAFSRCVMEDVIDLYDN